MMTPRVYITQYGGWWSCSWATWREFVRAMVMHGDDGYDLSNFPGLKQLAGKPASIYVYRNDRGGRPSYSTPPGSRLVQPLDWTRDDWESEAQELGIRIAKKNPDLPVVYDCLVEVGNATVTERSSWSRITAWPVCGILTGRNYTISTPAFSTVFWTTPVVQGVHASFAEAIQGIVRLEYNEVVKNAVLRIAYEELLATWMAENRR